MSGELERAGLLLRETNAGEMPGSRHASERARFVERAARPPSAVGRRSLIGAVLATAIMAAFLVLWTRPSEPVPLTFVVGAGQEQGKLGIYYAAPDSAELPLRFSDGSKVSVKPGGGVRVSRADIRQAVVLLEKGGAHVTVIPREGGTWQVAAGPYTVHVTGTEFTVQWDSGRAELTVEMRSGKVLVTGPGIESGVEVSGTERFVSHARPRAEEARPAAAAPVVQEPAALDAGVVVAPPATRAPITSPAARRSWSALAARGDYGSILREAEQEGLDRTMQTVNGSELSALADAARFSGRAPLARRALLTLRARFPGSAQATSAAFILGRLEDESGNANEALEWYGQYLSEGGPLAGEALGRKMVALRKVGRLDQARETASQYLDRFAEGPYAAHARDLAQ